MEKECDQSLNDDALSGVERHRLEQAKELLRAAGYVELPDGNFIRRDLAPKDGKEKK